VENDCWVIAADVWTDAGPSGLDLHPSAILRADDRETAYNGLVADLRVAAAALAAPPPASSPSPGPEDRDLGTDRAAPLHDPIPKRPQSMPCGVSSLRITR
jgi:hypothetical protein